MGILLADGSNGPFRFEIQHMTALQDFDPSEYLTGTQQLINERAREKALIEEDTKRKAAIPAPNSGNGDNADAAIQGTVDQLQPSADVPPPGSLAALKAAEEEKERLRLFYQEQRNWNRFTS